MAPLPLTWPSTHRCRLPHAAHPPSPPPSPSTHPPTLSRDSHVSTSAFSSFSPLISLISPSSLPPATPLYFPPFSRHYRVDAARLEQFDVAISVVMLLCVRPLSAVLQLYHAAAISFLVASTILVAQHNSTPFRTVSPCTPSNINFAWSNLKGK